MKVANIPGEGSNIDPCMHGRTIPHVLSVELHAAADDKVLGVTDTDHARLTPMRNPVPTDCAFVVARRSPIAATLNC